MDDLGCQQDLGWGSGRKLSHHGNTPAGMSISKFLAEVGRATLGWGPGWIKRMGAGQQRSSLSFVSTGVMWPVTSCSCLHAFPILMNYNLILWAKRNSPFFNLLFSGILFGCCMHMLPSRLQSPRKQLSKKKEYVFPTPPKNTTLPKKPAPFYAHLQPALRILSTKTHKSEQNVHSSIGTSAPTSHKALGA